jgi:hypothetical protein
MGFSICFHFAGHGSITQEFSAGPSEFLQDLHFLCKIVLKQSNVINFSKFEGIPSWIWLLFFGAWFQLFGLFWMVTGLLIFRPLPVLMKLNTESIEITITII